MANIKSQIKRIEVSEKERLRNKSVKHEIGTYIKKYRAMILADDLDNARLMLREIYSYIDSARAQGIYHANTAGRKKYALTRELNKAYASRQANK